MTLVLILLALPGVLAVLLRLSMALLRAGRYSVERYVAHQIVDQRASRGDLSGMAEADKIRVVAARKQMRFVGEALMWGVLLGLPLLFPPAIVLYPFYSIFWLVPCGASRKQAAS
ncbi:MAG: hypothetical protein ACT4O1_00285 [Gemmatimonadota bacterium]